MDMVVMITLLETILIAMLIGVTIIEVGLLLKHFETTRKKLDACYQAILDLKHR